MMFRLMAFQPSRGIMIAAVVLILASRLFQPEATGIVFAASVLVAMAFHMYRFELGRDQAAVDLAITLGGIAYLGWIAAYLVDLRLLPNGFWWLMLVLCTVWVADSAAYSVGVRFGRHKMSVRLSPKKSWEGYAAGVIAGTAAAGLICRLFANFAPLPVSLWQGMMLGLVLSTLTTLGDLGESLFKRFAGVKDSGNFLPGHGGAFDRIDSLIWAGVLGYCWIRFVIL
jgi:phosphatidate cytidylyltransferase